MSLVFRFIHQRWSQIFVIGALLFFGAEQALKFTGNPNLIPMVILLGAFVIPVAFVAYFYGQERTLDKTIHAEAPLTLLSACFLVGGIVGLIAAGFLEYQTLRSLTIPGLFGAGAIEESAKLTLTRTRDRWSTVREIMNAGHTDLQRSATIGKVVIPLLGFC